MERTEVLKPRTLADLIRVLHQLFAGEEINVEEVQAVLEAYESNPAEWAVYAKFDQYRWARSRPGLRGSAAPASRPNGERRGRRGFDRRRARAARLPPRPPSRCSQPAPAPRRRASMPASPGACARRFGPKVGPTGPRLRQAPGGEDTAASFLFSSRWSTPRLPNSHSSQPWRPEQ